MPNVTLLNDSLIGSDTDWMSKDLIEIMIPKTVREYVAVEDADDSEEEIKDFVPEPWMKHPAMWEFLRDERVQEACKN